MPDGLDWPALTISGSLDEDSAFVVKVAESYQDAATADEHPLSRYVVCTNTPSFIWEKPRYFDSAYPPEIHSLQNEDLVLVENLLELSEACIVFSTGAAVTFEFVFDSEHRVICVMDVVIRPNGRMLHLNSIEVADQRNRLT